MSMSAPQLNASQELYAAAVCSALPLSSEEWLLTDERGERHVLTTDVMAALDRLQDFQALDVHLARLGESAPEAKPEQISRVLNSLIQRGLLRSSGSVLKGLQASSESLPPMLALLFARGRSLKSLNAALASTHCFDQLIVINEGADAHELEQLRSSLAPRSVVVLTRADITAPELVTHASLLATDLNLVQWLGRGRRVLWLDDQMHLPLREHGGASLAHFAENALRQPEFALDHLAALAHGVDASLDQHVGLCGAALSALGGRLQHASLLGSELRNLAGIDAQSLIRATVVGTRGSAEGGHSLWLYGITSLTPWLQNKDAYDAAVEAQSLIHTLSETRIMRTGAWRALTLDCRSALAPVLGGVTHADRGFHGLASFLEPSSVVVHGSESIGRSAGLSIPRAQVNREVLPPSFNGFLADHAAGLINATQSTHHQRRRQRFADSLRDLAEASLTTRTHMLWDYLSAQQGRLLYGLQSALEQADQMPDFWRKDVEAIAHGYGSSLMQARVARLHECPAQADQEQASDHFAETLRSAASACDRWFAALS
jgi:hypothetical protein